MIEKLTNPLEQKIRNYFNYYAKLDNLLVQLEKKRFEGSPKDIGAINYDSVSSGTSKRQSAEKVLSDVQRLQNEIQQLKWEYKIISSALQLMKSDSPTEYKFIIEYYKNGKDIMSVALDLGYSYNSRNSIYKIKENSLKKIKEFGL